MAQERFKSRGGFILASVGAAVGLGDSLRFPGLCAKYGGGTFLMIYIIALLLIGIPVINAEIAIGRKFRAGAPVCMAKLNKKAEPLGWASCFNSLGVAVIYAGILGWIIAMIIKIVPLCKASTSMTHAETSGYFFKNVLGSNMSPLVLACILAAWALMYMCLRGGAQGLAKTAKFTVLIPVALLTFMAVRGLLYADSGKALYALFVPDFSALGDAELWINAVGQVFFSLSVLVGIMPAYGAYLPEGTNVFTDSIIVATADFLVSILSSVVLFTTLYGCGLQGEISESGIGTAFMVYPAAITLVFGAGNTVFNGIAGVLFYFSLAMMALQSSVSMIEAAANPLSVKFGLNKKKLAGVICAVGAAICVVFATSAAPVALDISDHYLNYFNILLLGIVECALLGRHAKDINLAGEINRYAKCAKMPEKPLVFSLKYLSPVALSCLLAWGIYHLIAAEGGLYGGYPVWAQLAFGWLISLAVFASGFIICGAGRRLGRSPRVKKLSAGRAGCTSRRRGFRVSGR